MGKRLRPVITLHTKLKDIPDVCLIDLFPKTEFYGYDGCWIWTGNCDANGRPRYQRYDSVKKKQVTLFAHRVMAAQFWEIRPFEHVRRACGRANCINPSHFVVTDRRWNETF